jgi:hypothetical protein
VKQPTQPSDFWDAKQALDTRAQQTAAKTSGYSDREFAMMSDRAIAILQDAEVPGGVSEAEQTAVKAKALELRKAFGIQDAQAERVAKQAPAPAPAPVAKPDTQPTVQIPAGAAAMNACMTANAQKYQKELEDLSKRAEKADKSGDRAEIMAIADSTTKLTMAGCGKGH